MEYDENIFTEQFPIVKSFLYHLTCYRELHHAYQHLKLKSEFWTRTIDAHLLQACILWCMVFGSQGNPTHWKNLCDQERIALENSFRESLFKKTEFTQENWNMYWKDMQDFRNGYAAHRALNYSKPVPDFKPAETIAYFYDEWIRELIGTDSLDVLPLKESVSLMQKELRPLAMHYLFETKLIMRHTE
ncbi:MAG: hypothetical protein JW771_03730 [Candidatus Thermoplasmatota archaeon]|nr:hypothetical protein [Candidatus Thermoplasmatota archaeon]